MHSAEEASGEQRLTREVRKLSRFMSQELLYEFSQGRLDNDRRSAIEDELKVNSDLRAELESIFVAEQYTRHLSLTKISPAHVSELKKIRSLSEAFFIKMKWQSWPDLVRWTFEALAISVVVAVIAAVLPWEKFNTFDFDTKPEITLAEIEEADPLPLDEKVKEVLKKPVIEKTIEPAPPPELAKPIEVEKSVEAVKPIEVAATPTQAPLKENKVLPLKGLLINIIMSFELNPEHASEIKDLIISQGGTKAGQVELGWKKNNPDGNYYHFSIPEENYSKLISSLGSYSALRIYKNPHERVMPAGKLRIILWIENKKP